MSKGISFFDFDGTITIKDSLFDFIRYAVNKPTYLIGLLTMCPVLIGYKLKIIPNELAKEKLITHYFGGWGEDRFSGLAEEYSREKINRIIRPKAIDKIRWHQERGHKTVIVSASVECWLKGWCDDNNMDLIATKLEIRDGKLTGKFAGKNCHGYEKAKRVKDAYDLKQFDHIYAYGDSRGDEELLALADKRFYQPFRER